MELLRQKNVATYIVFPLVDADGDSVSGCTGLDSEIDEFSDGAAPTGFVDCTNEATEIGSSGQYYLSLTQAEMNQDYLIIQIKSNEAKTQIILIRTIVGDPLNVATTDDNIAIDASALNTLSGHDPGENIMGTTDLDAAIAALPTAAENRAEMDSNSTKLIDILADTNELQVDDVPGLIAALNNISSADVAAELATYDGPTYAELVSEINDVQADIAALENLSAAQVAAELATYDGPTDAEMLAAFAALNNLSAAEVAAELATYDGPTHAELVSEINDVQADIASLNDLSAAEVNAEVDTALADINLDHLLKTPVLDQSQLGSGGGNEVVDGTILGAVLAVSGDPDGFNLATDSLEAIRNKETDIETDTQDLQTQVGTAGAGLTAIPPRTVEGAIDEIEAMKVLLAFVAGKSDGGGTATIHFRDQADSLNRITLTVDADGNRSATVVNVT